MSWFYARGEERVGPVEDAAFGELVRSGTVTPETLVWKEGMADWQPWGAVSGGAPAPSASPAVAAPASMDAVGAGMQPCVECGQAFPANDMVAYESSFVCANCKDIFFQRVREGGGVPGSLNYAGFWVRLGARMVDGFIMNIVNYGVGFLVGLVAESASAGADPESAELVVAITALIAGFMGLLIPMFYEIYFLGKYGATPGKMASGIKVVRSDGSPLTYGRATGRFFGLWLSYLTLLIGFIMAGFDDEKRALHDRVCDTRVVRK